MYTSLSSNTHCRGLGCPQPPSASLCFLGSPHRATSTTCRRILVCRFEPCEGEPRSSTAGLLASLKPTHTSSRTHPPSCLRWPVASQRCRADNMNQPNALISNGTCYHGASTASSDNVIPCGNVALGVVLPCCQAGDYCLDDSFCWNKPCALLSPFPSLSLS